MLSLEMFGNENDTSSQKFTKIALGNIMPLIDGSLWQKQKFINRAAQFAHTGYKKPHRLDFR